MQTCVCNGGEGPSGGGRGRYPFPPQKKKCGQTDGLADLQLKIPLRMHDGARHSILWIPTKLLMEYQEFLEYTKAFWNTKKLDGEPSSSTENQEAFGECQNAFVEYQEASAEYQDDLRNTEKV